MPSQHITDEEFQRIIEKIMQVKPYAKDIIFPLFNSWKWATMLWFAYYTGMRPRSIRLIEIRHIDFKNRIVYVPAMNSKTRKDDNFPFPEILLKKLRVYLGIRQEFLKKHKNFSYFLFPSSRNVKQPGDKNYLGEKLRRILRELNISKISFIDKSNHRKMNKSLYGLRKSFAVKVYQATKRIDAVEIALGHNDRMMRSAWIYIDIAKELERKEIMQKIVF